MRIIDRKIHASDDSIYVEAVALKCKWCYTIFERRANHVQHSSKQNKAGPFCDKSCAGKYSAALQNGKINKFTIQKGIAKKERTYYRKPK